MIPARFAPIIFGFFLSMIMSLIISGVSTFTAAWGEPGYLALWIRAWLSSWAVAFPAVLLVAPIARRIVARLVRAN